MGFYKREGDHSLYNEIDMCTEDSIEYSKIEWQRNNFMVIKKVLKINQKPRLKTSTLSIHME